MLYTVISFANQCTPLIWFIVSICFLWYGMHRVIGLRLPEVRLDEYESKINIIRAEVTDMLDRVDHLCKRWEKRERDAMRGIQKETSTTADQLAAIRRQRLNGVH